MTVYKSGKKKAPVKGSMGKQESVSSPSPLKLKPGMSAPIAVKFGPGQGKQAYVFADADHKKGRTTIVSTTTHDIIGVVKTVERYTFMKAVRWLLMIQEIKENLPSLFESVNHEIFKLKMDKDLFGLGRLAGQKADPNLVSFESEGLGADEETEEEAIYNAADPRRRS